MSGRKAEKVIQNLNKNGICLFRGYQNDMEVGVMPREVSLEEALETLSMFYNITPGQLKFICEEFNEGRGGVVINEIINHRYCLDKANKRI